MARARCAQARHCSSGARLVRCRASQAATSYSPLPRTVDEMVEQAATAIKTYVYLIISNRPTLRCCALNLQQRTRVMTLPPCNACLPMHRCPCRSAAAGHKRHIVELINPINEKERDFGSTEGIDYPCSNMKEVQRHSGAHGCLHSRGALTLPGPWNTAWRPSHWAWQMS